MLLPAGGPGVNLCGGQIARPGTRAEATEMTGVALRAPSVCWLLRGAGEPPGRRVHRRAGSQSPPRGCYTSAEAMRTADLRTGGAGRGRTGREGETVRMRKGTGGGVGGRAGMGGKVGRAVGPAGRCLAVTQGQEATKPAV